jgi:imidazolonepropionase
MVELGLAIVVETDFNPGSSPIASMPFVMSLACLQMGLSPAEALMAATINAAWSLGLGHRVGSLETGKQADFFDSRVQRLPRTGILHCRAYEAAGIYCGKGSWGGLTKSDSGSPDGTTAWLPSPPR